MFEAANCSDNPKNRTIGFIGVPEINAYDSFVNLRDQYQIVRKCNLSNAPLLHRELLSLLTAYYEFANEKLTLILRKVTNESH